MTTRNSDNNNKSPRTQLWKLKSLQKRILARTVLIILTIVLTAILVFSLTVAWYTNVVQTEGLTFAAKSWNFSGEVILDSKVFSVAPGDEGVVSMRLKNESDLPVAASVTVLKDKLNEQIRSKLYFYVDESTVKNGESVDRVYLGSKNSYTYISFPRSEILLSESDFNASLIKWEWVYDELGYYVIGQSVPGSGDTTTVNVLEFLRPIEYDYDEMKTTFDANGDLATIDGVTDVKAFLARISQNDGYSGVINTDSQTTDGYYPVEVDANGYGVWAYLCNYSEITNNSADDTELGKDNVFLGTATINISGHNIRDEGTVVATEEALLDALNGTGIQMVTLYNDITVSDSIVLNSSSNTLIDLNGKTLTSTAENIIDAQPGASVMVYNGAINGNSANGNAVYTSGATVTLSKVNITGVDEGVAVFDHKNSLGADSRIHIIDSTITGEEDALWLYGNGEASDKNTVVIIENSDLVGETYTGIICNGSYYGTDITIKDGSTVKGLFAGIYFPQKESTLTIEHSSVEGNTGIVVKGGTVNVLDSIITGTGVYNELPAPEDLSLSGFNDTGDGIYLESNYATETVINISGSSTAVTGTQENTLAVRIYPASEQASVVITGGTFSSDITDFVPDTGYTVTDSNGKYTVTEAQ